MLYKNKFLAFLLIGLVLACTSILHVNFQPKTNSILSDNCPPGFELTDDNTCVSRNLYQQYRSLQNAGVGGLKSELPNPRDGFSPEQIDLGRLLFFDPVLSKDGTISCASCHNPYKGFADGMPVTIGIGGAVQTRSAPSLWNVAYLNSFFWDGRASTLEDQMEGPLYSPIEMGNSRENLLSTLNLIDNYKELFKIAFPSGNKDLIELDEIYTAITAFESSLISLNSKYDKYAHGYDDALNGNEIEGLNICIGR